MGLENNLSPARKSEVEKSMELLFERYEASFNARLSKGEVLSIIEEVFADNRKNFIKGRLGPITFADRDYIVKLFETRKFEGADEGTEGQAKGGKTKGKKNGADLEDKLVGDDKVDGGQPAEGADVTFE